VSRPVDVLAVMDRIGTAPISETERGQVAEARDAVSELADAARAMRDLAMGPVGGVSQQQKREAIKRVDAALAKFGAQL